MKRLHGDPRRERTASACASASTLWVSHAFCTVDYPVRYCIMDRSPVRRSPMSTRSPSSLFLISPPILCPSGTQQHKSPITATKQAPHMELHTGSRGKDHFYMPHLSENLAQQRATSAGSEHLAGKIATGTGSEHLAGKIATGTGSEHLAGKIATGTGSEHLAGKIATGTVPPDC